MEISTFWLYVIMKLDAVGKLLVMFGVIGVIVFGICAISAFMAIDKNLDTFLAPILLSIATFTCIFMIVFSILLPSTKEAAILIIAPKVLNSDFVNKDLPAESKELYDLAKKYLKGKVKESN